MLKLLCILRSAKTLTSCDVGVCGFQVDYTKSNKASPVAETGTPFMDTDNLALVQ
jgi:hypothetical protein